MTSKETAQEEIARTGELWANGKYGSPICLNVQVYPPESGGRIIASAEQGQITERQMLSALRKVWPDFNWKTYTDHGYLFARTVG